MIDRQTRVHERTREAFVHFAKKIVNGTGLESAANLSIDYEPSFQSLTLHFVQVLRNGRALNRLSAGKIQLIQRESELEYQLYDGTLSAVILLEDVRVGDVVEYAYSLRGANPVFEGRYLDSFSARWDVPVHHQRWRLLWPSTRALQRKNHNTALEPVVRSRGAETEYLWEQREIAPLVADPDVPGWYDAGSWVQLSEFASWSDVASWADRRFTLGQAPRPELARKIAEIRAAASSPEAAVLLALRFVQDDVRYLGIEVGANSHQPTDPEAVVARRFGDCKDKTLLFCAILRGLGVGADPVLVNTSRRQGIASWQPTPTAFNHVVARAELGGRVYWLDPTLTAQGGTLDRVAFPDFGRGLLVRAGTDALLLLPHTSLDVPSVSAFETFVVKGEGEPADLEVETRYERADADRMRARLGQESREEIERAYLRFYTSRHSSIRSAGPLEVQDDRERNLVTTRERYQVPDFWVVSQDQKDREFEVNASAVQDVVGRPGAARRTAPLGLRHPVNVMQVTELRLSEPIGIVDEAREVTGSAVRFSYRSSYRDQNLRLEYSYASLKDGVPASDMAGHLKDVAQINDVMSYRVTIPRIAAARGAPSGRAYPLATAAALVLFLPALLGAMTLAYRYRPTAALDASPADPALDGLGGWLTLIGLNLLIGPIRLAMDFVSALPSYAPDDWSALTTPGGPSYHVLWGPLLLVGVLGKLLFLGFSVLLVPLFLQRRRSFPWFFIVFMVANQAFVILDGVATGYLSATTDWKAIAVLLARAALPLSIWIPYFLRSRRVAATFTR